MSSHQKPYVSKHLVVMVITEKHKEQIFFYSINFHFSLSPAIKSVTCYIYVEEFFSFGHKNKQCPPPFLTTGSQLYPVSPNCSQSDILLYSFLLRYFIWVLNVNIWAELDHRIAQFVFTLQPWVGNKAWRAQGSREKPLKSHSLS